MKENRKKGIESVGEERLESCDFKLGSEGKSH